MQVLRIDDLYTAECVGPTSLGGTWEMSTATIERLRSLGWRSPDESTREFDSITPNFDMYVALSAAPTLSELLVESLRTSAPGPRTSPCRPALSPRTGPYSWPVMNDGPLIVQSDKTLLLEVDHEQADAAPQGDRARSPSSSAAPSTSTPTGSRPLGLWNARAAGHDAEQVVNVLLTFSRYAVPHALLVDVAETMARYGRLRLDKHPVHGLVLTSTDRAVFEEVLRSKKIAGMLGDRLDDQTASPCTRASGATSSRPCSSSAGRPRTSPATSTGRPTRSSSTRATGRCAPTSRRPPTRSGTAGPGSSYSPVGRARPWSAPPPWPAPRRPP